MQPLIEAGDLFEYKDQHSSSVWDTGKNLGKECSVLHYGDYFVVLECDYIKTVDNTVPMATILLQKNGIIGTFVDWHKRVSKK